MKTEQFGGTGHGMPAPVSPQVAKEIKQREEAKRKQQTENFAKNSLPSKETTTTTIHDSNIFPFQIVEVTTTTNEETQEYKTEFYIGMMGEFVSKETFSELAKAEKYIASRPWELITNLVCLTFKNAFEYEKSKSNS